MAGRGAPIGNNYAKKGAMVRDGLVRALARDDWRRFNQGCERIANAWAKGEPWAAQFVADRIDGRVIPQLPDTGDGTLVVSWVMHGAPTTSEHSLSSGEVIDHSEASGAPGPIRAIQVEPAGHAEIETDGGVGGGGVTPPHTSGTPTRTLDVTPVPRQLDGGEGK